MDTNIVRTDKHEGHHDKETSLSERKSRLLRQAEFHRNNILSAKSAIKEGARPEVLFHKAVDHATFAVRTRVDNVLRPTGITVATVSPYALSLLSFLRQRRMLKPAIGVVAAAAGLAMFVKHRRHQQWPR